MASAPILDFAALLAPIPGDSPAGSSCPLTQRQKLESMRKEFEPNPDDPSLPPVAKKPDWSGVHRLTQDILTTTSKDLETAFRLGEALVKLYGFAGLRDTFLLLHGLIDQCWDRLHPTPDEGEGMEVRSERFYWITDAEKGARFSLTVRGIPSVKVKGQELSYHDFQLAMKGQGPVAAAAFDSAEPISPDVADDLAQGLTGLTGLEALLKEKYPTDAPSLAGLRQALEECQGFMNKVLRRFAPAEGGAAANGNPGASSSGSGTPANIASRDEAYRQIGQIANVLEQLEPHSPIPYLLRRAIELGRMPFRQLVKELVRDPGALETVSREFGIKQAEAEASGSGDT